MIEDAINPDLKDKVRLWLTGDPSEQNWSNSFLNVFEHIFGPHLLTFRSVLRSFRFSLIALFLVTAVWIILRTREFKSTVTYWRDGSFSEITTLFIVPILFYLIAVYVSLLITRYVLRQTAVAGSTSRLLLLFGLDGFTAIMIAGFFGVLVTFVTPIDLGYLRDNIGLGLIFKADSDNPPLGICLYAGLISSIWAWLHIASGLILRTFRFGRLERVLNVKEKPIKSLGIVAGALASGTLTLLKLIITFF